MAADRPVDVPNVGSDDCLILLEEIIRTNRSLVEENERLRRQYEASNTRHSEVLQRIERRLENQENRAAAVTGRARRTTRARQARQIAVPPACRVSIIIMLHI